MNVVDSSGWLSYFAGDANAEHFGAVLEGGVGELVVPSVTVYEVYKRMYAQRGEAAALEATAAMLEGEVVDLTAALAIDSARLSAQLSLPMADAIILATAQAHGATLWTQDAHFEDLPNVEFRAPA